jgi:hypothetical protein
MASGRKHIDNYFTAGGVVAALSRGCNLQTHVEDDEGRPVYLEPEDELCSECGELIGSDSFGSAPYGRVLGNMKRKHGATYCPECHDSGSSDDTNDE